MLHGRPFLFSPLCVALQLLEQTRSARTGDEGGASAGIQRHLAAGVIPCRQGAGWVLGVRLRRTQLAALAPS
jgi:hypothetical protein